MKIRTTRSLTALTLAAGTAFALAACAGGTPAGDTSAGSSASTEVESRVTLTYDGGLFVLDGSTLDLEADLPLAGFNRVNPAGDGRNVLVSTEEGFRVLDTARGSSTDTEPKLTDLVFEASKPGHVVRHGDKTILFADGTGDTTIYETDALLDATDELPETETIVSPEAHHGVSIELEDGTLLTTIGTPDSRTGVRALDADRKEISRSEECPSVHGEGTAADEIAVFGCSDGVLVYADGVFTKVAAADVYGRTGNAYVSETSPIMIGDYNSDPDAEGSALTALTLVDTEAKSSKVVELPDGVAYTWRDVARTANDDALILGTDGSLHVLDVETGEFTESYPVIDPWEGPAEWQDAHPALVVVDGTAYVTDPATTSIHAVDVATGTITATGELTSAPIEIAVVTG
jgi:outer membrane protein assembly factor BamB